MSPIVFVHGTRSSSSVWQAQVDAMTRHGHQCVAVDLPGHGSLAHERFTLEGALGVIDDAVAALSAPPLLVGLSLGGYSSIAYAARNPGRVAGVVLSGCSTEIKGKPLRAYRLASTRITRLLRPGRQSWDVVADMLTAMSGYSAVDDLRRLRVPVWLVNGRWDIMRIGERRYVAARPGTRLTVVPRAGHDVILHAPVRFTRVLMSAVAEVRAAGAMAAAARA